MNPERIAEIRRMPHDNWRIVHELLDALDAANAELSRLRSSPAPVDVIRGVTHMAISWEVARAGDFYFKNRSWREWKAGDPMENASSFAWVRPFRSSPAPVVGGVPDQEWNGPLLYDLLRIDSDEPDWEGAAKRVHDWFTSRLPALKPGEVVAIEKIIAVSRVCANEGGTDRRCCVQTDDHHIALLELDKIRAQPTPTEKETDHAEP